MPMVRGGGTMGGDAREAAAARCFVAQEAAAADGRVQGAKTNLPQRVPLMPRILPAMLNLARFARRISSTTCLYTGVLGIWN